MRSFALFHSWAMASEDHAFVTDLDSDYRVHRQSDLAKCGQCAASLARGHARRPHAARADVEADEPSGAEHQASSSN